MPNVVFFSANDVTHGYELWVTDGTPQGTRMVRDINPNNSISIENFRGSTPQEITDLGDGRVVFRAEDNIFGGRDELWVSDGTAAGTAMVRNIGGSISSEPAGLTQVRPGLVVFVADDGVHGRELWVTDGTYDGTRLLMDINQGATSAFEAAPTTTPRIETNFASLGYGRVVFAADDGVHGKELWVTDGTPEGTRMLRDAMPGSGSGVTTGVGENQVMENGRAVFVADDGTHGRELWVTDGTPSGTRLLQDSAEGSADGNPSGFLLGPDGRLGYQASSASGSRINYRTDGTEAGTDNPSESPLTDVPIGRIHVQGNLEPPISAVSQLGDGNTLFVGSYFELKPGGDEYETLIPRALWITNGTPESQRMVFSKDEYSRFEGVYYKHHMTMWPDGRVAFIGDYKVGPDNGRADVLIVTDGTSGGTTVFSEDIREIRNPTTFANGFMIFAGEDANGVQALWSTNGTGITRIADVYANYSIISPEVGNGQFLMSVPRFEDLDGDGFAGNLIHDLWVTDGTAGGTRQIVERFEPSNMSSVEPLGSDKVVISYSDPDSGISREPWVINLNAGVQLLGDIKPGSGSSNPLFLTEVTPAGEIPIPVSTLSHWIFRQCHVPV